MNRVNNDVMLEIPSGNSFFDRVFEESLRDRVIVLNSEITQDVIEMVVLQILKFNKEDKNLPIENRKRIKLYINSCGGEVASGYTIIDSILASKTPVDGVLLGYGYSMGSLIYLACDRKYAFINSTILIHDGNVGASSSGSKFKDIAKFYDKMDDRIKKYVLSRTKMTPEFYDAKYEKEFYIYADEEGRELGIVDKIIGVDCDLDEIL
jgi:ATP-dependent Clp protease protease subunit